MRLIHHKDAKITKPSLRPLRLCGEPSLPFHPTVEISNAEGQRTKLDRSEVAVLAHHGDELLAVRKRDGGLIEILVRAFLTGDETSDRRQNPGAIEIVGGAESGTPGTAELENHQ